MISLFRISCMDRVGKKSEFKTIVENAISKKFQDGHYKSITLSSSNVLLGLHEDSIELSKLLDATDDSLIEIKDKIVNALVEEFNARSICVVTYKRDGYSKHDFIECKNYYPPKKNFLIRFFEALGWIK